jgi:hypothetical protein
MIRSVAVNDWSRSSGRARLAPAPVEDLVERHARRPHQHLGHLGGHRVLDRQRRPLGASGKGQEQERGQERAAGAATAAWAG